MTTSGPVGLECYTSLYKQRAGSHWRAKFVTANRHEVKAENRERHRKVTDCLRRIGVYVRTRCKSAADLCELLKWLDHSGLGANHCQRTKGNLTPGRTRRQGTLVQVDDSVILQRDHQVSNAGRT